MHRPAFKRSIRKFVCLCTDIASQKKSTAQIPTNREPIAQSRWGWGLGAISVICQPKKRKQKKPHVSQ
jgi:hypothetical protein